MANPYVIEAKRMMEIFSDREWAVTDLHNLIPHLINEVERLEDERLDEETRDDYEKQIKALEGELKCLEKDNGQLEDQIGRKDEQIELSEDELDALRERVKELEESLDQAMRRGDGVI